MDYLLDTTTISYLLQDEPAVTRRFGRLYPGDHAYSSVVSEAELRYGALRLPGSRGSALASKIDQILNHLDEVLSITRAVAVACAGLKHRLAIQGRSIPVNDLWIAAVAVAADLVLVAHDKDFLHIEGLRVEDWLEP